MGNRLIGVICEIYNCLMTVLFCTLEIKNKNKLHCKQWLKEFVTQIT